jgi:hypothetical protein
MKKHSLATRLWHWVNLLAQPRDVMYLARQ